jgi:hypothetical protein
MSTFLYGANVRANGIRQHYLRYGGRDGQRGERDAVIIIPGITSRVSPAGWPRAARAAMRAPIEWPTSA